MIDWTFRIIESLTAPDTDRDRHALQEFLHRRRIFCFMIFVPSVIVTAVLALHPGGDGSSVWFNALGFLFFFVAGASFVGFLAALDVSQTESHLEEDELPGIVLYCRSFSEDASLPLDLMVSNRSHEEAVVEALGLSTLRVDALHVFAPAAGHHGP